MGATSSCGMLAPHCSGLCHCRAPALGHVSFRSCGTWAFVALWHVESSWTRYWNCVPCSGRWIPNHWTRESPIGNIFNAICVFKLIRLDLVFWCMVCLWEYPVYIWEECILLLLDRVFLIYLLDLRFIELFRSSISLFSVLYFYMLLKWNIEDSSCYYRTFSPCNSVSFCITYFDGIIGYINIIVVFS